MKLAFFSSSPLALPLLKKLKRDLEVVWVITTKEKPDHKLAQKINDLQIDLAVVIDYGLLIPKMVFDAPKFGTINIHFSLLPKYRGANPDSFVILNKEKTTGISFVLIDEGFDTGDILAQKEVTIFPNETAGELHQRLYQETEKIMTYIIKLWGDYKMGKISEQKAVSSKQLKIYLPPKKQNNKLASYTKRLGREDGYIKWKVLRKILNNQRISVSELSDLIKKYMFCHCEERSDEAISKTKRVRLPRPFGARNDIHMHVYNFYRALSPWPGIWTQAIVKGQEKRLKILKCHWENNQFIIDQVQLEGKNPVSWKQFCEGYKI